MRLRLSRDPAARRRLKGLALACFTALVSGAEIGARSGIAPVGGPAAGVDASATASARASEAVSTLSLEQQVGQLVVLRFVGPALPAESRDALRRGEATGAIVFEDNVVSEDQVSELSETMQLAAGGSALVAVDQEGGSVRRLPFAAPEAAASTVSSTEEAERLAVDSARDLDAVGINVNFAPVADIASVDGSVMAGRAYPGGAQEVAALVDAAVEGHSEGGVASTAKHFPGIGAALGNTDFERVTIGQSRERIVDVDLTPFRAALDSDVELVMASHALYPSLDEQRIASQSRAVIGGLLREQLGYDGVVVTDALEAEAVVSRSSPEEAAVRSVTAGVDLVLTTAAGTHTAVHDRLLDEARRSDEFRARVEESAARVVALKQRMELAVPGEDR